MSQIPYENDDDNRSVADSDFAQIDQPDEVPDQEAETQQQQETPQIEFQQNPLDWTMNTGGTRNYEHDLKEQKLIIANLEVFWAQIINFLELLLQIKYLVQESSASGQGEKSRIDGPRDIGET
jgi:hypothetical protein